METILFHPDNVLIMIMKTLSFLLQFCFVSGPVVVEKNSETELTEMTRFPKL